MQKKFEITNPQSCLNKAKNDEFVFVLIERDPAIAITIRFWCEIRLLLGKNLPGDPQIIEALHIANLCEQKTPQLKANPSALSITRCPHGFANTGNCNVCRK